jgi:hypothetical protein
LTYKLHVSKISLLLRYKLQRNKKNIANTVFHNIANKLALAHFAVPMQLRGCIKMYTSKAFIFPLIQTLQVSAKLVIIRCTNCRGNCCPAVTLLHFEFLRCKILLNILELFLTYHAAIICCSHVLWSGVYFVGVSGFLSCCVWLFRAVKSEQLHT